MIVQIIYLFCAVLFILAIHGLSVPQTAVRGNYLGIFGMAAALAATIAVNANENTVLICGALIAGALCGVVSGVKVKMTVLPQMVALLNGAGGLASALIVYAEIKALDTAAPAVETLCFILGLITFSGSLTAFAKLQGLLHFNLKALKWVSPAVICGIAAAEYVYPAGGQIWPAFAVLSLLLGLTLTFPVGGADMPVVISILNALSGWTVVLVGVSLNDLLLLITGALIGASGCILAYAMSRAMNRSLLKILWPESRNSGGSAAGGEKRIRRGTPEEAAFFLSNARKVIIVPGFGMAAAQAQNALKSLSDVLTEKYQVEVKFAVHPVAGRMPGHMNVLLAEAKIPYESVFEMADINQEFASTDAVYVIGANDVTNPAAKDDLSSPLYGMPVLDVEKARTIFFVKRSLSAGYSGADNPLFYSPNTIMLFGDAREVTEKIVKDMQQNTN